MLKINKITLDDKGTTINYDYEVHNSFEKYFNKKNNFYAKYDCDLSKVPNSILVIPFLSNVMPIAWFAGFDVYVDELDNTFYNALKELKIQFVKHNPNIKNNGKLTCKTLVNNKINGNASILLFSGGLDSYESLIRNYTENPYLISIHGADVEIKDKRRWKQFKTFNNKESIIDQSKLVYIESNLRDFYTYKVDLLIDNIGWWGEIQHGMALLGVLAPLTTVLQANKIYIASSNTKEVDFSWGSRPEVDENMKWSTIKIIHDGYHLRRPEKIVNVIDFAKTHNTNINLRVCYSELRNGANCNICPKCQRTMLGIILAGDNPSKYGFEIPSNFYELLLSNFQKNTVMSKGLEYEWWCLQEKAKENGSLYIIKDEVSEKEFLEKFKVLNLKKIINLSPLRGNRIHRIKFIMRNKFSGIYKIYKSIINK